MYSSLLIANLFIFSAGKNALFAYGLTSGSSRQYALRTCSLAPSDLIDEMCTEGGLMLAWLQKANCWKKAEALVANILHIFGTGLQGVYKHHLLLYVRASTSTPMMEEWDLHVGFATDWCSKWSDLRSCRVSHLVVSLSRNSTPLYRSVIQRGV